MAQYIGGPAQFMTSDDIKYRPTDGWFVSYKKATSIVIFIIFVLIVVGLIGWYSHATPTKRVSVSNDHFISFVDHWDNGRKTYVILIFLIDLVIIVAGARRIEFD